MKKDVEQGAISVEERFERGPLGWREYELLAQSAIDGYQQRLLGHICDGVNDDREHHRILWREFVAAGIFDVGDEIIAFHGGNAITLRSDVNGIVPLNNLVRVHGVVEAPVIIEAPIEGTVVPNASFAEGFDPNVLSMQTAAGLRLSSVSIEVGGTYASPSEIEEIIVPLCYKDMLIKKRVGSSLV